MKLVLKTFSQWLPSHILSTWKKYWMFLGCLSNRKLKIPLPSTEKGVFQVVYGTIQILRNHWTGWVGSKNGHFHFTAIPYREVQVFYREIPV